VLVENLDVIAGVFLRGKSVELAADRVDLLGNVFRGPALRALEEHVLDEVGDPAVLGRLVSRTAGEPDPDRHRTNVRHRFGHETETVGERLAADAGISQSSGSRSEGRGSARPANTL
jgi:hypothetical protein